MGLCGLVESGKLENGQTVGMFSYGSGSIATMYQLKVQEPKDPRWSLQNCVEKMKMRERLDERVKIAATEVGFSDAASFRRFALLTTLPFPPV